MILKLQASDIFSRNASADSYIIVNQGGTSSGKTYAILQLLLTKALSERLHISVCSITLPHLKKGALKDWIDILTKAGIYSEEMHNRSDNTFHIGQSFIEFFSLDNPAKARGPRRDILFINEANLIPFETYNQLVLRTRQRVYLDYNPADEFHWIYDKVLPREDCTFIKSTYKDNPFLPEQTIREIERLRDLDTNLWRVYGEGERGTSRATIYTHYQLCDALPEGGEDIIGLDFGYNNPTALVHIRIKDGDIYVRELLYRSGMTNSDLLTELSSLIRNRNTVIYGDAAEPQRIEEIHRAGFNIKPADKSVKDGIDRIRRTRLFITNDSLNLIKEIRSYKYQEDKNGKVLEEPVKLNDHLCDAMRYAVHTYNIKPSGNYAIW